jgi:hypothetical protein
MRFGSRLPLTGRQMGAQFTMCAKRPAAPEHGGWRSRSSRTPTGGECSVAGAAECDSRRARGGRISRVAADEMRLGLRRRPYRAPDAGAFHYMPEPCPNRPTASEHGDQRGRNSKGKRGRPPGRRMLCGWRRGNRGSRKPSADAHSGNECRAAGAAARGLPLARCARTTQGARPCRQPLTTWQRIRTQARPLHRSGECRAACAAKCDSTTGLAREGRP